MILSPETKLVTSTLQESLRATYETQFASRFPETTRAFDRKKVEILQSDSPPES